MGEEVKKYFQELVPKIHGLMSIIITDRDGVPLFRCIANDVPELQAKHSFLNTFNTASDQASKLNLGRNQHIICMYNSYQVLQMNKYPLAVTFIGNELCNAGHILALESQIDKYLDIIKHVTD